MEPVTIYELKKTLGLPFDYNDEDSVLSELIQTARVYLEEITWSTFLTRSRTINFSLPENYGCGLFLPYGPVQSITSLKYQDLDNEFETIDTDDYFLENENNPASISFVDTFMFPSTYHRRNNWQCVFVAGYGSTAESVPVSIRTAIKLTAKTFYEAGDCSMAAIPDAVHAILGPYDLHDKRVISLA